MELTHLQKALTEALATSQEKEGSAVYWKLQHENVQRELKDEKERNELAIKSKKTLT